MMADQSDGMAEKQIETIVVDPDDVVEAVRRNWRDKNEQHTHVLRVSPPFEGTKRATPHVDDDYTYYPPGMDPTPLHLSPSQFIGSGPQLPDQCQFPVLGEERQRFLHDQGYIDEHGVSEEWTDEMEAEWNEWWDTVVEVIESNIRNALLDTVAVKRRTRDGFETHEIEIRYQEADQ